MNHHLNKWLTHWHICLLTGLIVYDAILNFVNSCSHNKLRYTHPYKWSLVNQQTCLWLLRTVALHNISCQHLCIFANTHCHSPMIHTQHDCPMQMNSSLMPLSGTATQGPYSANRWPLFSVRSWNNDTCYICCTALLGSIFSTALTIDTP